MSNITFPADEQDSPLQYRATLHTEAIIFLPLEFLSINNGGHYMKPLISVLMVCVMLLGLTFCNHELPVPDSGNWYCKELECMMNFDDDYSYAVIEGVKHKCYIIINRGSTTVDVGNQENSSDLFGLGEFIYSFECIELDESVLVVYEVNSGMEYRFIRQ